MDLNVIGLLLSIQEYRITDFPDSECSNIPYTLCGSQKYLNYRALKGVLNELQSGIQNQRKRLFDLFIILNLKFLFDKICGIQKSLNIIVHGFITGNKVAFVAASSQGLGYAVAKELLQEGCHVIISGRKIKNLEYAVRTLSDFGKGKILALADVSAEKDVIG